MEEKAKGLAGAENMRILRFEAEHIKKIQVVRITPAGNVIEISGKNGAGKTSILDSIWWALAGTRNHQSDPIQHGHDKGRIKLDLGAITGGARVQAHPCSAGETGREDHHAARREDLQGQVMQSPQMILDHLLGALSFDPLAFARKSARDQYQVLEEACGVDLQAMNQQNEADYLARTIANRTVKEKRTAGDSISVPTEIPIRIDVAALVAERQRREKLNDERAVAVARRESLELKVEEAKRVDGRHTVSIVKAGAAYRRFTDAQEGGAKDIQGRAGCGDASAVGRIAELFRSGYEGEGDP